MDNFYKTSNSVLVDSDGSMIKKLYLKAWNGYLDKFWLILAIVAIGYFPFDIFQAYAGLHIFDPDDLRAPFKLMKFIDQFFLIIPDAAFIYVAYGYFNNKTISFSDSIKKGFSYYFKMWLTRFLIYLSFFTFFLLVFPGIYLLTRWLFSEIVVIREGLCGTSALKKSWEITKGKFWQILGVFFAGILPFLAFLLITIISYAFLPFEHWGIDACFSMALSIVIPFFYFYLMAFYEFLDLSDVETANG